MTRFVNIVDAQDGQYGHDASVLLLKKLFRARSEEPEADQWSAFWDDDEDRFTIDLWTETPAITLLGQPDPR